MCVFMCWVVSPTVFRLVGTCVCVRMCVIASLLVVVYVCVYGRVAAGECVCVTFIVCVAAGECVAVWVL